MKHCIISNVLVLALLSSTGCSGPAADTKPPAGPPTVTAVQPQTRTLVKHVEQPGVIRAFEEAPLYAKLPGFVRKIHADIGDKVDGPRHDAMGRETQPGQLLAELAIPELEEEVKHKQALARQAGAELEQAGKNVPIADAAVAAAEALVDETRAGLKRAQANYVRWESESQRINDLVKTGNIDKQTRDETLNQMRAADAARDEALARVHSTEAAVRKYKAERDKADFDVKAAEAKMQSALAGARRAEALLGYTMIRAPFDGVVTRRGADAGHFLQPMTGPKAEPVYVVQRLDTVRVFVEVPELDAMLIKPGAPAAVRVQSLKNREFPGGVTRQAWALDPASRTLTAEIDLPNPERVLRPGMYAYAKIETRYPDRLVLPLAALVKSGDALVCYVLDETETKVIKTPVQVGVTDGTWTEVLKKRKPGAADVWEPFRGDEKVAGDNAAALSDGAEVKVAAK